MKTEVRRLLQVAKQLVSESGLFSPEEMAMPAVVNQSEPDSKELYEKASEAREQMLDWLDRGEGIDQELGLRYMDVSDDMDATLEEVKKPGSVLVMAPLKNWDRAKEKVEADYEGDWTRLVDIARATVALETPEELVEAMGVLRASMDTMGLKLARRPDDNFSAPTVTGYRGIKMNVVMPNGHIVEIQVHLKSMFETSLETHDLYEKIRGVQADAAKGGRDWLTEDEKAVLDGATRELAEEYRQAWKRATSLAASVQEPFVAGVTTYFEYKGSPVEMLPGRLPVAKHGGMGTVVRDLVGFMHGAKRISRVEFENMGGAR